MNSYPNLFLKFGWKLGVHRAPQGYEHPWLVVLENETLGAWSREEARVAYRQGSEQEAIRNNNLRSGEEES